ncbi:MAG: hypothetical protein RBT63_01400 [Bdellovibrionales bacterium]|jgi:hypothetical protein|nr:hypothetical protein [Bdellovibrionales bacterium]
MFKLRSSLAILSPLVLATALSSVLLIRGTAHGQAYEDGYSAIEVTDQPTRSAQQRRGNNRQRPFTPRVGRQAASKYMSPQRPEAGSEEAKQYDASVHSNPGAYRAPAVAGPDDHYLAIHFGWFASDSAYNWGRQDSQTNVGNWNAGLTYRVGEWVNSMDLNFRFDVSRLTPADGRVTKFSFLPLFTFPEASSRFPLYFGAGIGLGIFGNQIADESTMSIDYQLVAGARLFNLWGHTGFFVEGGMKNHFHIFSDGQYNGTFIATGLVFTF